MKLPVASHTMLNTFDNCPYKGFRMYIARDLPQREQTDEMRLGSEVHKALSMYITRARPLGDFQKYAFLADPMSSHKPLTEMPLAVTREGRPCGFFDDNVFCRGYGDVVIIKDRRAVFFDWKTGKKREEPAELELHGMMLHAAYPKLEHIVGHYVWLRNVGTEFPALGKPHVCSNVGATWGKLEQQMDEIEHMLTQNHFPKQPNPLCSWCPVMDCEHNKVQQ
jgi:hypothetical protein